MFQLVGQVPSWVMEGLCQNFAISTNRQAWTLQYRGGSNAGTTGAWAPADIQQRVPGTRPEISLGAKVLICYQKYQNIKIRFDL